MPKPLTIGVDVRELKVAKTGIKTYLEELCRGFKKMNDTDLQFHFLDTSTSVYNGTNKWLKWFEHFRYQLWKQVILPIKARSKKCDIVFCVDACVPYIHLGYKTIHTIHDAFIFETPENYGKIWLWLYLKIAIPAAKRASFIITPTTYAKKQLNYYTDIANTKFVVIYESPKSLDESYALNQREHVMTALSLTPFNYIIHVGSMFKRKNIPFLINAFAKIKQLGHPKLKLVLAGPIPYNKFENDYQMIFDAIENSKLQDNVILTGYLSDADLSILYKNALLYAFPSINEGFGIPILEAFKNNLPVLVANNTCLPEVGGDAVLTFNPFDIDDIFYKIKTVLDDAELRKAMIRKGQERLKEFSWQKTAEQIVEVFRKAVKN